MLQSKLRVFRPLSAVACGLRCSKSTLFLLAPTGILQGLIQAVKLASFACSFQPASLELRILDLLEALHAALHLLRSRIVSALGVLVNVQLVMLSFALVLALDNILPQNLSDGLDMLDGVIYLF